MLTARSCPVNPSPAPSRRLQRLAYSTPIRKALDKLADDKDVKALVLRVNSPGGSAVASEIILNATKRVKAKKPFVVSMGSVAGSGGYYVSMGADTIFAGAATITASIGVLGGSSPRPACGTRSGSRGTAAVAEPTPAAQFRRGVHRSGTQENARLDERSLRRVQGARGRGPRRKLKKPIDELAAGRVFTGQQALDLGLVDKIGTLEDAIQHAAEQAKLKDYEVRVYPEPKNFMEVLLEELSDGDRDPNHLAIPVSGFVSSRGSSILDLALPHLKGLDRERLER